jgi:hypothetical protein
MRFATAKDVLLAFPQIALGMKTPLDATPSLTFLKQLAADGGWPDCVAFIAHVLPRREAVGWAAKCVRLEPSAYSAQELQLITAVQEWARQPRDEQRQALLAQGEKLGSSRPAAWVAKAAGWSGGVLMEQGQAKVMCEPHMSPAAVRGAILLASAQSANPHGYLRRCVEDGIALLNDKREDG